MLIPLKDRLIPGQYGPFMLDPRLAFSNMLTQLSGRTRARTVETLVQYYKS